MALSKKELAAITAEMVRQAEEQAKISNSLEGYIEGLKKVKAINKTIARNKKIEAELDAKWRDELSRGNIQEAWDARRKLNFLKEQTRELERQGVILTENIKTVNKGNFLIAKSGKALFKSFSELPDIIEQTYKKIRGSGLFEMDKAIRKSALSMGLMTSQTDNLRFDIQAASDDALMIGVGIEELAKMQADYSNEVGRAVMLNKDGLKAVSDMAIATNLGAEGATKLAADFEQQGLSAERTKDFVEETVQMSHKMGLNTSKVIKNIQQNIKLLNKYNFKGGIKGLAKMAETTTKLGIDMNSVSGMAEKLFDIEGAVDMSAQLQVMGGAWAKMADPFHLMYMARNDMEGLTEEIGKAAESSVHFNKESGDFEISSLEMHRLRKIAEQTGMSYDDLATAGKNAAKFTKIKSQVAFNVDKDTQDFLANTAKFTENGDAYIEVKGEKKLLKTLTESDKSLLKNQMLQKKSLDEMAKDSRTFDDALTNTINIFKKTLLPLVETMNDKLLPKIDGFIQTIKSKGWLDKIGDIASKVGGLISYLGGWILDNPIESAFIYGAAKITGLVMDNAKWFANGLALAEGFNVGSMGNGGIGAMATKFASIAGPLLGAVAGTTIGLSLGAEKSKKYGNEDTKTGDVSGILSGLAGGAGGWALGAALAPETGGLSLLIPAVLAGLSAMGASTGGKIIGDSIGSKIHDGISPSIINNISEETGTKRSIIAGGMIHPIDDADSFLTKKDSGPVEKAFKGQTAKTIKHEFGDLNINGELKLSIPGNSNVSVNLLKSPELIKSITEMILVQIQKNKNQIQRG